ncbi:MAG TPA: ATP-binding protein, partial [Parvularculaceae bacterium]|nr:ATP-binding protein [Parvularculaceae bacterium]
YRAIAGALRDDARAAVKRREHMSAAIWLTTIAAIIIEWIFLLRPIGFKVAASVEEIEKAEERTKAAAEAAEAANASKSNFLRVVSHEIRTPMNAVTGISQLLQKTSLPPAVADYVRQLAAASDHLMGLTGNVLDLSQLESGALKLAAAPFRLADELRRCVQIIAPLARDKGIAFAVDIHETAAIDLEGDAGRLRQIVLNLLSNALKFTDRGSISLTCSAVGGGRDHAGFRIKVVDTGIGVSPETLPQIFRSFEQLDSFETRRKGGAGLGLAIVSELVAAMGGSVSVESTPHVGSTFVVALSLPVARKEQAASAGPAGAVGIRRKVLVVEDNIPNQMIAKAFLKAGGFDVTIANNGQEALDAVAGERFDLVLMDINMPVMDGLEATRILRQDPNYRKTPILAFTAHAIDEDQNSLLSAGLDDVLKKPVTEKGLVDRVRLWIANDNPADAA